MRKNELRDQPKMTDLSAIETDPIKLREEARAFVVQLLKNFKRQHDVKEPEAMEAVARRAGLPKSTVWQMKYRPPKTLDVSVYNRLKLAYARYIKSPEATIAENLAALRALPSDPARDRLLASLEEYLRIAQGPEVRPASERTDRNP